MKLKLYTSEGAFSKEIDLDLPTFTGDKGLQALKESIVAYRANRRAGTHSTKTRGEVRGGGKKPWRQKGTGRARAGSTRSPIWVGGGRVFGPRPRSYFKKLNHKVKVLAFMRALFDRVAAGDVEVIENWVPMGAKTGSAAKIIRRIVPQGALLLVDTEFSDEGSRSARNLAGVSMQEAAMLNSLDLIKYPKIVVSLKALNTISRRATVES